MKYVFILSLLIYNGQHKNDLTYLQKNSKDTYVEQTSDAYKNCIVFENDNGVVSGTFYGTDLLKDSSHFYYKSIMRNLTILSNGITFTLDHFLLSKKPFLANGRIVKTVQKEDILNLNVSVPHYFRGRMYNDTLELNRVVAIYDSRADNMIFKKKN